MPVVQIKRRESAPSSISQLNNLMDGELGYIKATNQLYIGTGVGNDPVLINDIDPDTATKNYVNERCKTSIHSKKVTADGTSSITFTGINVSNYLVYCNGLLLIPGENYTVSNTNTINLVDWTAEAEDYFTLVGSPVGLDTTNASLGNDYAEYRSVAITEPGRCVIEAENGIMKLSTERMQPGAEIISDTFGHSIGKSKGCETPIAISGRVLAYPNEELDTYTLGCAVCSGPNGTISQMTREEIKEYPERIIGTVSELPKYESWNGIPVNGRIWIRVR